MTIRVSTHSLSRARPSSATRRRRVPSKVNGLVTTPTVRMPISLASLAITGAAPVPVPPPMPPVTNRRSVSVSRALISSLASRAAISPTFGSPPELSPPVSFSPMWSRRGALDCISAWASVLMAMSLTPRMPSSIIRSMTFDPPPPTPTTAMLANSSA